MQESVSMDKSPTPFRHSRMNQVRSQEEEKKRLVERIAAQKRKNLFEELKQGLPKWTAQVNKLEEERLKKRIAMKGKTQSQQRQGAMHIRHNEIKRLYLLLSNVKDYSVIAVQRCT